MGEVRASFPMLDRLPPRPPAVLDKLLDATEQAVARYGVRRTSMTDLARELGVARTTLYRQVTSVEEALALVASRQVYRFLDRLVQLVLTPAAAGPDAFMGVIVDAIAFTREHPVVRRVLEDEPEIVGAVVTRDLEPFAAQVAEALQPVLAGAMDAGLVRRADPQLAAEWLVRVAAVLIVLPAPGDLGTLLDYALRPVLQGT
jgi:AcrR family transcriptional regulator